MVSRLTFSDRTSRKLTYSVLGYLLHSDKSSVHHSAFGRFMKKAIEEQSDPSAQIPSFLADGELALRSFIEVCINLYISMSLL